MIETIYTIKGTKIHHGCQNYINIQGEKMKGKLAKLKVNLA